MIDQGELALDHNERLARLRARLLVLAKEMLDDDERRAEPDTPSHGVTFADVRIAAETRGWTHEDEFDGRELSFGAAVMREAGGTACEYRTSRHKSAKSRPIRVFRKIPKPSETAPVVPRSMGRHPGWTFDLVSGMAIHDETGARVSKADMEMTKDVPLLLRDRLSSHRLNMTLADG